MDLRKSYEFFRPEMLGTSRVHIIGCGAVGSTIAENLCRFGVTQMTLWDFDTVEAHNVANQMFRGVDIGKLKVDALAEMLTEINPDIKKDLKLSDRIYRCNCGNTMDRDVNAAVNIRLEAMRLSVA